MVEIKNDTSELSEKIIARIKGEQESGRFEKKGDIAWWLWEYPHSFLVGKGLEEPIVSKTGVPSYKVVLESGKEFTGIPIEGTKRVKKTIYNLANITHKEDIDKPLAWRLFSEEAQDTYGHILATHTSTLQLVGWGENPAEQNKRVDELRTEILEKAGNGILLLMNEVGY